MRRRNPNQVLKGIDVSHQKIEQARRVTSSNISFEVRDIRELKPESFDSISVVDVLVLLSSSQKLDFLRACYSVLFPGGILVVKETSDVPRWKAAITLLQEILAVNVFKITKGQTIAIRSAKEIARDIVQAGFTPPMIRRIDRGYLYPHTLFISRKYE
jgi:2-polyprenyl-3-methyl-5-hydroxy-6-metoxy-1,4-benzoquinol methylase